MTALAAGKLKSPVGPWVLALGAELKAGMKPTADFKFGDQEVSVMAGADSVWAIVNRRGGRLALRLAYCPGGCTAVRRVKRAPGEQLRLEVESAIGLHTVSLRINSHELPVLRATIALTPAAPSSSPCRATCTRWEMTARLLTAQGRVEAAQRGMNSGLSFFHLDQPAFGTVLYFQNLTAMNDYYRATRTKPDGAVGGEWPEIGYLLPTPPQSGTPPVDPLPAGKRVTISTRCSSSTPTPWATTRNQRSALSKWARRSLSPARFA